uniref:Uncharacterized protein n=1 Tax=Panagrolaimus sp. ES5 TaxID=591445 RepID=A0AC34F458_9BILA
MATPSTFEVPLITKFWDIDYGTYLALPLRCSISTVIEVQNEFFTLSCTKIRNTFGTNQIYIEVLNPPSEFDYLLSTINRDNKKLNTPITTNWIAKDGFATESYRIFISVFLYSTINENEKRQKIREHVRSMSSL